MARFRSDQKMGYYPTPDRTLRFINQWLSFESKGRIKTRHILDPCCGEGRALWGISSWHGSSQSWGIELDVERAQEAAGELDNTIQSSIFDARINPLESMGLLYLNPPYDSEDGERMEMKFLKHSIKWLAPGGILCFVVPEHLFERKDDRDWIAQHFDKITVMRAHREDFLANYKQAILFGVKRSKRLESADMPAPPYGHIEDFRETEYLVPATEGPTVFQTNGGVTPEEIYKHREASLKSIMGLIKNKEIRAVKPITLARKGHIVSLLSGGALNGKIQDKDGRFIVVKGYSSRISSVSTEEDKEITRDTYSIGIRMMKEENGKWKWEDIS